MRMILLQTSGEDPLCLIQSMDKTRAAQLLQARDLIESVQAPPRTVYEVNCWGRVDGAIEFSEMEDLLEAQGQSSNQTWWVVDLEEAPSTQRVECTLLHVRRDGAAWSTYRKHDSTLVMTDTIPWAQLKEWQ